jgi:hypothetical protein
MTFFDFIKSLLDSAKERLKTPITGAFIWSFIIYNWRPMAVLFFSNASIEDRIVVVNYEYFNGWLILPVIFVPILMSFIYTVAVPMLMVKIDKILAKTKKDRIEKIYEDKGIIMDGKIRIAEKEFILKNKESGNKQIEDFITQITGLEETNTQMTNAHNNKVNQLNAELAKVNKEFGDAVVKLNEYNSLTDNEKLSLKDLISRDVNNAYDHFKNTLTSHELEQLADINLINNKIKTDNLIITDDTLKKLSKQGLVYLENGNTKLTDLGFEFLKSINKPNKNRH